LLLIMAALIVAPYLQLHADDIDDSDEKITAEAVAKSHSLSSSYFYLLETLNSDSSEETLENIEKIKTFSYEETFNELFKLIQWELEKAAEGKKAEMRIEVVNEALTALIELSTYGNVNYLDLAAEENRKTPTSPKKDAQLERLQIAHDELKRSYSHSSFYPTLEQKFMVLERALTQVLNEVPYSIYDILYRDYDINRAEVPLLESSIPLPKALFYREEADATDPNKIHEKNEQYFKQVEADLNELVIEQPEVVKALVKLERRNFRYTRVKPEHLMLMGLPGGGKDTIANAYAQVVSKHAPDWQEHLFSLPIAKDKADLWQIGGSATGYVGSEQFPKIFDFLVKFSGGRYIKKERTDPRGKVEYYIEENKEWAPGKILPGVHQPSEGILFVNEFHNWSRENKDIWLKQAVERGIFFINNPNGGVDKLIVPITFIIASNDGMTTISSRELSGERFGKPLSYEQMMKKWENVHNDKSFLRELLKKTRGGRNQAPSGNSEGTSEEMANRIQRIFLLRPISPDGLVKIARMKLNSLKKELKGIRSFGPIDLEWTPQVEKFIQSYQYQAEENARPIGDRVDQLIQETIDDAIANEKLKPTHKGQKVLIDVVSNGDGTFKMTFQSKSYDDNKVSQSEVFIEGTLESKDPEPLSEEERSHLRTLGDRMKSKVFGIDAVAEKVAKAIVVSEKERKVNLTKKDRDLPKARRFMFLGLTGTGKTELAKVLAEELYGDRSKVAILDFSTVGSKYEFNQMFTGEKNSDVASEFMKEYDKNGGEMIVVLDEIANAPREVLKAMYPFLDEGEVTIFNDGKARKMSNITFIATGNAGEEWYQGIPEQVPEMERRNSMEDIYKRAMKNTRSQEVLLQKFFSEALIGRFGIHNIMFFPPHSFKSVRQMIMLKLKQMLKMVDSQPGKPGWELQFENPESLEKLLDAIEKEGYIISEQGRSIDNYIKDILRIEIDALLEHANVPYQSKIIISLDEEKFTKARKEEKGLYLTLDVEGGKTYPLFIRGKEYEQKDVVNSVDQTLTAYHEIGHELVRHIFFSDKTKPQRVKIIPGVDWFGTRWIYYAGVAEHEDIERKIMTRELVLREMAIFAGGYVAQQLVTKGAVDDAGKRNDMERATELANNAIFRWVLAPHVTRTAIGPQVDITQHIQSLDPETLRLYRKELESMMHEAESLARRALLMNYESSFVPMSRWLAEVGEITEEKFEKFYAEHKVISEVESSSEFKSYYDEIGKEDFYRDEVGRPHFYSNMSVSEKAQFVWNKLKGKFKPASRSVDAPSRDAQLLHPDLLPNEVADIAGIIAEKQERERKEAGLLDFDYRKPASTERAGDAVKGGSCRAIFAAL
ncbi:MAG: AAA family ATPase, partial [Bdellovibrionales bacterium]|nr:AAA family ATPase [Bdellovibrionales bacterium]